MKKSICIITPAKFPGTAGDTATLTELIQALLSEEFIVTLICPKTSNQNSSIHSKNLHVIRIPTNPPRLNELSNGIALMQKIRFLVFLLFETFIAVWFLKRNRVKHVILRPSILTFHLPPILKFLGVEVIGDVTELIGDSLGPLVGQNMLKIINSLETRFLRNYAFFKVCSESHADVLKNLGVPSQRIIYMPFSINLSNILPIPIFDIAPNTFGYFGVLESWQGVDILVEAFMLLQKRIPSARLYIIGEGSMVELISKKIREYHLADNITLVNSVSRETLWETYFKKFRVVVIPRPRHNNSIDNILPIKLIEAMAAAKPVIASDISIMREIPKDSIMLFNSRDPQSLASCMERLCEDAELLKNLSENGLKWASRYDIRSNIKKITSILGDGS